MTTSWPISLVMSHIDPLVAGATDLFGWSFAILGSSKGGLVIAAIYVGMIIVERLCYLFVNRHQWNDREAFSNILSSLFVEAAQITLTGGIFFSLYTLVYEYLRIFTLPISIITIFVMLLANDLCHYLDHRMQHRVSLLWALHIPHHSSTDFNVLVANRGTVLLFGLLTSPIYLTLPLLGFPLSVFLFVKFFGDIWGTFSHTKLVERMGFLEGLLSTPSNHRVHHGIEPKYIDKNYGQVFVVWDRLFGTYQREEEAPTFGLIEQMPQRGLWHIQTYGVYWLLRRLATAENFRHALALMFRPPEWSIRTTDTTSPVEPVLPANQSRHPNARSTAFGTSSQGGDRWKQSDHCLSKSPISGLDQP
jgi:sterol desaturase/sphingolipid hydroxylase (fatty acid hydroxylase superfamily)